MRVCAYIMMSLIKLKTSDTSKETATADVVGIKVGQIYSTYRYNFNRLLDTAIDGTQLKRMRAPNLAPTTSPSAKAQPSRLTIPPHVASVRQFRREIRNSRSVYSISPLFANLFDKPLTKTEQDMSTLKQLVFNLIEDCCLRMRITGALSLFLANDGDVLRQCFPPRDAEFIINSISEWETIVHSDNVTTSQKVRIGVDLYKASQQLSGNKSVKAYIIKSPFEPAHFTRGLIRDMHEICRMLLMNRTAEEEIQTHATLRSIHRLRSEKDARIEIYKQLCKDNEKEHSDRMAKLDLQIRNIKKTMREIETAKEIELNNIIEESAKELDNYLNVKISLMDTLKGQGTKLEEVYALFLQDHLKSEAVLRKQFYKNQTNLEQCVKKYDTNISLHIAKEKFLSDDINEIFHQTREVISAIMKDTPRFNMFYLEKQQEEKKEEMKRFQEKEEQLRIELQVSIAEQQKDARQKLKYRTGKRTPRNRNKFQK